MSVIVNALAGQPSCIGDVAIAFRLLCDYILVAGIKVSAGKWVN